MAESKWTKEQLAAIEARDCNLLVAAAAGSGKTAVLVERLIRLITDPVNPVDVDRLLVVTFTKAAAAEMKERIGRALMVQLNQDPGSTHLYRQLTLLNRASVTTLHSFCLEVIRRYFYRLDLDPAFRVADDTEAKLLRLEALEELFEDCYTQGDQEFLTLVDAFGGERDDERLKEVVLRLHEFAASNPWPEEWLQRLGADYRVEGRRISELPWTRDILDWVELQLQGLRNQVAKGLKVAEGSEGPAEYIPALREDLALIEDLLTCGQDWQALYTSLENSSLPRLASCRNKNIPESVKESLKQIHNGVKDKIKELKADLFSRPPEELLAELNTMAPRVERLATLVGQFAQNYLALKKAKALVDFGDLEHFCLAILRDPASCPGDVHPSQVALEMQEQFVQVLVDEYQDTNAVQDTILQLVSRCHQTQPNLFMVGDVKQSIYRFRQAEPSLFMFKYQTFSRESGSCNLGIDLARNFRSRQGVVDGVNFVFRQIMTPRVGEMPYDDKAELVCGAEYLQGGEEAALPDDKLELHIIEKLEDDTSGGPSDSTDDLPELGNIASEDPEDLDASQREARVVAGRILKLLGKPDGQGPEFSVLDKQLGEYRPLEYRDIVILLRAPGGTAGVFLEEFSRVGIPAYAELGTGYFAATEVETMMSLLKVIDNPEQDIPLAAVLRSGLVGLTGEELARIRLCAPGETFFTCVQRAGDPAGELDSALKARLSAFLLRLRQWRTLARQSSLADLIWRIYTETGFYAQVGATAGGHQRQANLRALHDRARQYESTSFRGLFRFLRFIENLQDSGNDLGAARALGEQENVVRIMSIHKSKGLEFPVVIVAGTGKDFNTLDLKQQALMHKELGLGLPVVDTDLRITYPSLAQLALKKRIHLELLAEEMRILYVALTRAREKLIIVGSVRNIAKKAQGWCASLTKSEWSLPDSELAAARSYLDWLVPVVARHRDGIQVRQLAGTELSPSEDSVAGHPACWELRLWSAEEAGLQGGSASGEDNSTDDNLRRIIASWKTGPEASLPEAGESEASQSESSQAIASLVATRLSWQYPYPVLATVPSKVTVTEIKRQFGSEDPESASLPTPQPAGNRKKGKLALRPRFMQEETGLSPAEKGTAMHLVMQHLRLAGQLSEAEIQRQAAGLEERELLTSAQVQSLNYRRIADFFTTPLGLKMVNNQCMREVPFTIALSARELYPGLDNLPGEQILLQGVIDCLIEDHDGLILLDYKTDRVTEENLTTLVNNYRGQLKLYAQAVETLLGKKVRETYLYFFTTGQLVSV